MKHLWNSCCVVVVLMTQPATNFDPLMKLFTALQSAGFSVLIALAVLPSYRAAAQSDPAAEALLTKVSETMQGYASVHAVYLSKMIDRQSDFEMDQTGEIWVEGNRYHLVLGEYTIICDGQTVWTYEPEMGECYVDDAETIAEDGIDPARMFTIWEEGFTKVMKGDVQLGKRQVKRVDLHPESAEDRGYHTIQCYVDPVSLELVKLIMKGREGTDVEYRIEEFEGDVTAPEGAFTFDKAKYPGTTLIDNRL